MSPSIQKALERILGPLAKLLLSQGITHGQISEMLKMAMVREALRQTCGGDRRIKVPTDSRISISTGIHRKDIKRLRGEHGPPKIGADGTTASQVISRWLAIAEPPPLLTRNSKTVGSPKSLCFDSLVQGVSTDIRPRAVLDELIARGIVTKNDDGRLMLHADRLVMNQGAEALADYLGMNLCDHFHVALSNLLKEGEPQLDRCVHFHGISEKMATELHDFARAQAMQALVTVNRKAQKLSQKESNRGKFRFNFGAYFRKEEQS